VSEADPSQQQLRVELSLPATAEWIALARTTGAAIASRWQFSYDEIADLRLAIDELCLALIRDGFGDRLDLVYLLDAGSMEVTGKMNAGGRDLAEPAAEPDHATSERGLSERILDALVDGHGSEADDDHIRAWLRKDRSTAVT
jgi:hypothetical protein